MPYVRKKKLPHKKGKKPVRHMHSTEAADASSTNSVDTSKVNVEETTKEHTHTDSHSSHTQAQAQAQAQASTTAKEKTKEKKSHSTEKDTEEDVLIISDSTESENDDSADDLKSIYDLDDDEVNAVDMTKMDQKHSKRKWVFIAAGILVLVLFVGYSGYRIFNQNTTSGEGSVELTVAVEEKVASGDMVTIDIEYMNHKNVEISSGDIEVFYPDGFYFQNASDDSVNDEHRVWQIEHIQPGTGGTIHITGQLVGTADEQKEFSALLTYQPANFSHDFQESAKISTTITTSTINLDVQAPEQVQSGQEMKYTVEYKNTSTTPIQNAKLIVEYPQGFQFSSASQEPTGGNNEWKIETLDKNSSQKIEITGKIDGASGETKEFNAKLGIVELDNTFSVQNEKKTSVIIVNPEIELLISAPQFVSLDDNEQPHISVTVKNTSELDLKQIQVQLTLNGNVFTNSEYTFEPIDQLAPLAEKELIYDAPLKTESTESNQELEVIARVTSATVEGNTVSFPNEAKVSMKLKGSVDVSAQGRYFDDNLHKIGSGPLPPVAEETTTYVVYWDIANGANTIKNVDMSTTLPAYVTWEGTANKNITYDSSTRKITYSKETIDPYKTIHLEFEVSITPTLQDVDSLLILTGPTKISGTDNFTGEQISQEEDRITTELSEDEGAAGKGVIQEPAEPVAANKNVQ